MEDVVGEELRWSAAATAGVGSAVVSSSSDDIASGQVLDADAERRQHLGDLIGGGGLVE